METKVQGPAFASANLASAAPAGAAGAVAFVAGVVASSLAIGIAVAGLAGPADDAVTGLVAGDLGGPVGAACALYSWGSMS